MQRLLLASQSPRRAELLEQMALPFEVVITHVDESRLGEEAPADYVERLARAKSRAGYEIVKDRVVDPGDLPIASIGADTIVVLGDEILGKPRGLTEGKEMLRRLSGRMHEVLSGVAVCNGPRLESAVVRSEVTFGQLTEQDINAYWDTGEGLDKAGSYGIQGIGGILVERLEGSFSAVMGLPVRETEALLRTLNIDTWSMRSQWLKNS